MLRNCIGRSIAELHLEKQIFPSQRQNLHLITWHSTVQFRNIEYLDHIPVLPNSLSFI